MATSEERYQKRREAQQGLGGATGKTAEQLAAEKLAAEQRAAKKAKEAADKLAAEQAAAQAAKHKPEFEAHKKTEDWKLKVGKGDIWGAAKSWWNTPDKPKKRKGDMVKNYARGGGVRPADNEYK